ncbi:MAG: hypothetical protein ACT4QB_05445 [Gammaproteobacteria bacterium]
MFHPAPGPADRGRQPDIVAAQAIGGGFQTLGLLDFSDHRLEIDERAWESRRKAIG